MSLRSSFFDEYHARPDCPRRWSTNFAPICEDRIPAEAPCSPCSVPSLLKACRMKLNRSATKKCMTVSFQPRVVKQNEGTKDSTWSVNNSITVYSFRNMSRFAEEKKDSLIPCIFVSRTNRHYFFRDLLTKSTKLTKRHQGSHAPGYLLHEPHVAAIKEPLLMMVIAY